MLFSAETTTGKRGGYKTLLNFKKFIKSSKNVSKDGRGMLLFSLTVLFYRMFKCGICLKPFNNEDAVHQHRRVEHFGILYE